MNISSLTFKFTNQVAGGECDKRLGNAMIKINILGCPGWSDTLEQPGFEMLHNDVPAQFLEVQIEDISDDSTPQERIIFLYEHFQTEGPIIHTINLLDTETEDNIVGDEQQERKDKEGSPGIADTGAFDNTSDNQIDDTDKLKESVRFQYDGKMIMEVTLRDGDDLLECANYTQAPDPDVTQSFHVLDYMKPFAVNIQLRYELIAADDDFEGVYCDKVDEEEVKIQIVSNVGMDDAAGFQLFWDQLSDTDQGLLSACSTIPPPVENAIAEGPCIITPVNENGNFAGRNNVAFVTGRPYPVGDRNTRFMLFQVLGVDDDVRHTSEIFIQGLYTKGPGSSFALPTHYPIMVLRDPPGKF